MPVIEETNDMSFLQIAKEHEHRLTKAETNIDHLHLRFSDVNNSVIEIKEIINKGNSDQIKKLELIDNRLMEEFFQKKRTTHDTKSKIALKVTGGVLGVGGFLYLAIDKIVSYFS